MCHVDSKREEWCNFFCRVYSFRVILMPKEHFGGFFLFSWTWWLTHQCHKVFDLVCITLVQHFLIEQTCHMVCFLYILISLEKSLSSRYELPYTPKLVFDFSFYKDKLRNSMDCA